MLCSVTESPRLSCEVDDGSWIRHFDTDWFADRAERSRATHRLPEPSFLFRNFAHRGRLCEVLLQSVEVLVGEFDA